MPFTSLLWLAQEKIVGLKNVPLGVCKVSEVMPIFIESACIPGYFTNHSLYVTPATRLYDARVDEDTIMLRTRHSHHMMSECTREK